MTDIKHLLKGAQENVPLAQYTTFKIGGPARYFFIARTGEDIKKAAEAAKELKIPHYIIGNGSNILFSDSGFDGLIIKTDNRNIKISDTNLTAEAGVVIGKLVNESVEAGLSGLEWMIGIPGTLGGAIYGNAGAFGHSISEAIESVKVFDSEDLVEKTLNKDDCGFAYRHSVFQPKACTQGASASGGDQPRADKGKKYIILSASLKLKKGKPGESAKLIAEYLSKRKGKHPIGPSAGSVFKNPSIAENRRAFEKILAKFSEAEKFREAGKIPAGWLIEEYGLRGKKIGGAMVAKEHGNFILNIGGAKAEDVVMLISLVKQKIRVNFGIQLEEEIQYVGF